MSDGFSEHLLEVLGSEGEEQPRSGWTGRRAPDGAEGASVHHRGVGQDDAGVFLSITPRGLLTAVPDGPF